MGKVFVYVFDESRGIWAIDSTFHSLLKALALVEGWKKTKKRFVVGITTVGEDSYRKWFDFSTMEFKDQHSGARRFMMYGRVNKKFENHMLVWKYEEKEEWRN